MQSPTDISPAKERYHLVPVGLGREGLVWSERAGKASRKRVLEVGERESISGCGNGMCKGPGCDRRELEEFEKLEEAGVAETQNAGQGWE